MLLEAEIAAIRKLRKKISPPRWKLLQMKWAGFLRHRGFVGQDDEHYTQAFSTLKPLEDDHPKKSTDLELEI